MKYIKTIVKMLLVLIICSLTGIGLLCLVFLLPVSSIHRHVKDSAYVFSIESDHQALDSSMAKLLDNHTDTIMLGNALFYLCIGFTAPAEKNFSFLLFKPKKAVVPGLKP